MSRGVRGRYPGRWLTGLQGSERAIKLSIELNRKSLERANSAVRSEFLEYRPWMSCHERLGYFASSDYAASDAVGGARVVSDAATLSFLNDAFSSSPDLHLGHLGIAEATGLCVETLDMSRAARIAQAVPAALDWIVRADESLAARAAEFVKQVIPMGARPPLRGRSPYGRGVSSHLYRGGIIIDLPEVEEHGDVELAINLAHEMGHQALMVYQNADPIIDGDLRAPVYSAIRREHRPAIKSFHALVALAYMKEFAVQALGDSALSSQRRARLEVRIGQIDEALRSGARALRESGVKLTALGGELLAECESSAAFS